MKSTTLSRRFAAAGAVSALAAGVLVGTATTADAAQAISNQQYDCTSLLGNFPVFVTSSAPALGAVELAGVAAGADIAANYLQVNSTVTIPDAVHSGMVSNGVDQVTITDLEGNFGPSTIGIIDKVVALADFTQNPNTTWSATANTFNEAFEVPAASAEGYDVVSFATYHVLAHLTGAPAGSGIPIDCTLPPETSPGVYGHVPVYKNDSTTAARPTADKFKKGKLAKVAAKVTSEQPPTGKVLLKNKAGKTLDSATLNDLGKAVLETKALPVGKNNLTVVYKGDGYNKGSKKAVTVKVVR